MKNNTMVQEDREQRWCSCCANDGTKVCEQCVFAGIPTKYKIQKPTITGGQEK